MLALDTNVLVYAFFSDSPFHGPAKAAVDALAESPAPWAIPWPCVHEFYAVTTNPKIFTDAALPTRARAQLDAWLASPSLLLLGETANHWRTLAALLERADIAGPAVHDARIAAICLDNGVTELLTLDRDFARFPQLTVRNLSE